MENRRRTSAGLRLPQIRGRRLGTSAICRRSSARPPGADFGAVDHPRRALDLGHRAAGGEPRIEAPRGQRERLGLPPSTRCAASPRTATSRFRAAPGTGRRDRRRRRPGRRGVRPDRVERERGGGARRPAPRAAVRLARRGLRRPTPRAPGDGRRSGSRAASGRGCRRRAARPPFLGASRSGGRAGRPQPVPAAAGDDRAEAPRRPSSAPRARARRAGPGEQRTAPPDRSPGGRRRRGGRQTLRHLGIQAPSSTT
ncbi:UNVERIFIED_ORG: hypothetical protein CLV66_12245 [Actinomadura viridilutea]